MGSSVLSGAMLAVGEAFACRESAETLVGMPVTVCVDSESLIDALQRRACDAVLCDLTMAEREDMALLRRVRASYPEVAFLVVIEPQELRSGILAMLNGASGYVVWSQEPGVFLRGVAAAVERHRLNRTLEGIRAAPKKEAPSDWGISPPRGRARERARRGLPRRLGKVSNLEQRRGAGRQ